MNFSRPRSGHLILTHASDGLSLAAGDVEMTIGLPNASTRGGFTARCVD